LFFTDLFFAEASVGTKKRKKLEAAVAAIQGKWGFKALHKAEPRLQAGRVSTGFPALDQALHGIEGLPRGRMTEMLGAATSGMVTLALKAAMNAQLAGDTVAYIDLTATFDPDYADRCGLNIQRLLLVRPANGREGLAITHSLIERRGAEFIIFDNTLGLHDKSLGWRKLSPGLPSILRILAQSRCVLVFLTPLSSDGPMSAANYPAGLALPNYATLRLQLRRERWIHKRHDIRGYQAQVIVVKNKLGRAGQTARISITFNGTVRGDST
jgi:recombination protein RecA